MPIRTYQPGDESVQVGIYNTAATALPGFKPAHADEVSRRYQSGDPDPEAKFYAVENGAVVGYAVFNANGRISYPWCLPSAQAHREPLLDAVLAGLRQRGHTVAWATYRGDWEPVLSFFAAHGFTTTRTMINYVAELAGLPHESVPPGQVIRPMEHGDLPALLALSGGIIDGANRARLVKYFWENPYFDPSSLFVLTPVSHAATILGVALLNSNANHADPTRIDASMPCFRLGTFGTEHERHKRVNGLFSAVFASAAAGETLLAEAARRLEQAGATHLAAQAPSDQPAVVAFHDRFLRRQGSFPILSRSLT
jgi:L-amino acid N-acyltransferase YncA